jgi:hypothetical protein
LVAVASSPKTQPFCPSKQQTCHQSPAALRATMAKLAPAVAVPTRSNSVPGPLRTLTRSPVMVSCAAGAAVGWDGGVAGSCGAAAGSAVVGTGVGEATLSGVGAAGVGV